MNPQARLAPGAEVSAADMVIPLDKIFRVSGVVTSLSAYGSDTVFLNKQGSEWSTNKSYEHSTQTLSVVNHDVTDVSTKAQIQRFTIGYKSLC